MSSKIKWLSVTIGILFLLSGVTTGLTTVPHFRTSGLINTPPNIPSVPDGPTYRKVGETGTYSTVAIDPDGDQIKYLFNWGDLVFDETDWVDSGTTVTMEHFWMQPGNYRVTAQAMDPSGSVSTWSSPLGVQVNKPPNPPGRPDGPQDGCTGIQYAFCMNSTDPDNDAIQYLIDWGDETNSGWSDFKPSGASYCVNKTWYHAMNHQVDYTVRAKARDIHGTETEWSLSLIVTIHPTLPPNIPQKPSGPATGFIGETYFYCTNSTHPINHPLYYQFDWDDGTTSMWQGPYASGVTDCASHNWSTEGSFNVKVKAKDDKCGPESEWSSYLTVIISKNMPPEVPDKPTGPIVGKTGKTYIFSASTTDFEEQELFYNFSWGDNTYSPWIGPYESGELVEASHNWSTRDKYQIRVKAKDILGEESDWSDPLTVTLVKNKESSPLFLRFFKLLTLRYLKIFSFFG